MNQTSAYRIFKRFAFFLTVAFSLATSSFSQGELTTITGTVTDTSKAVISDADVTIRATATHRETRATTNPAGLYYITSLPPDTYELTVEKKGFRVSHVANIPLTVGLTATIDVSLEIGTVNQSVDVTATPVQLEAQTSAMESTITTRAIEELPNVSRNPLSYAALVPGVIPTTGQQAIGNQVIGSATTAQIGGGLAQQNEILIDGAESRGTTESGLSYSIPLEAVAEFRVDTSTYSAEFGRALGGVAEMATKAGTDQFHGTGWEFFQNDVLNANSWQNNRNSISKALYQQNQFGGNIGGPIIRNKTFFFFNYEGTRQGSPDQVLGTVPTDLEKAANFSHTFDAKGDQDIIYDPNTTRPDPNNPGHYLRDPFQNDTIPAARLNQISTNVLKYYPEPNRPGQTAADINNFLQTGKSVTNKDNYLVRMDHYLNQRTRIFGRFGYTPYTNFSTLPGSPANSNAPGYVYGARSINSDPATAAMIAVTSTFTPNLLGEARLSYTRLQYNTFPVSAGFNVGSLGFPASVTNNVLYNQFPAISVQTYATGGGLAVTGAPSNDFDPLGGATRTLNPQDTWQAQYHLTVVKTRHSIKFGTDDALFRLNAYNSQYSAGQYIFDRTYTQGPNPSNTTLNGGNGLASLLLGVPVSGTLTITHPLFLYQKSYALYVQDDYRVTNHLTLNLGLRWEYTTPYAENFGQIGDFNPTAIDPVTGLPGVFQPIKPGGYQENPQYKHFEPRVWFAWQLNNKTVIRAAGAIMYANYVGVNDAATDFGNGGFLSNLLSLGAPNSLPNTPPVGGSWNNPFAGGIIQPNRSTSFVGQAVRADELVRPTPYMTDWNFNIQRALTPTLLLEVGYVGSKVTHLYWNRQDDANNPTELSLGSKLLASVPNPFYGKIKSGALSFPTIQERQLLLPFPQYQAVLIFRQPYGDMEYESATIRLQKQMSHGLLFTAAYTKSKTIDDTAQSNTWIVGPSDSLYDPRYNRSIDANDVPQRFVASYIYDLPFGKGKQFLQNGVAAAVLGNWEFSGITVLQKGTPLLITAPDQTNLINFISTAGRADRIGNCALSSGQSDNHWFNTAAFITAPAYTLPTDSLSQPNCRGPGIVSFNLSLIKNIQIMERYKMQFRFETYNTFNHPVLSASGNTTIVNSPQFGQIVNGGAPRNVQLGLRILF
ncbi:MAG: carboxypeptidase regulatory-like domain-containing protein [Acidobacteriota bacterium]|nr:carboxypeptidase regulatory-like domain-containing protein [Acidobacteriota bacterium]